VQPRAKLSEQPRCTVLKREKKDTLQGILDSYLAAPARWKDQEFQDVTFLAGSAAGPDLPINFAKLAFKENLVKLAAFFIDNQRTVNIKTATDVLRLAAGLSDGDVSLKEKSKFKSFKKAERRFLLSILDGCQNFAEDAARRPELWKRLVHQLHPHDFKSAGTKRFPNACKVSDDLYNDKLVTFNSRVEALLTNKDAEVLSVLSERPGDFRRRLVQTLNLFGDAAAEAFIDEKVLSKLTTIQVVTLRSHLETIKDRKYRAFPPKGNWNKLQIVSSTPTPKAKQPVTTMGRALGAKLSSLKLSPSVTPIVTRTPRPHAAHISVITAALSRVLAERLPKVKVLDAATKRIKLATNGSDTGTYTRGTAFPIPDGIEFVRTGSYWKTGNHSTIWFDNGWNFFDSDWKSKGAIAWNAPKFENGAAAFSGDPLSSKDVEGRACQVIDLYLDKLVKGGVRFAVWNVLCFSNIPFSQAEEVFSTLQWGEQAQKGKLFEPSLAQLAFPLTGDQKTKYICLIDLEKREMVYLDANLHGQVNSAVSNGASLEKNMPAFMEYLEAIPSVHDLFRESVDSTSETQVLYSDKDTELKGEAAYVFRHENKANKFKAVDINSLLT